MSYLWLTHRVKTTQTQSVRPTTLPTGFMKLVLKTYWNEKFSRFPPFPPDHSIVDPLYTFGHFEIPPPLGTRFAWDKMAERIAVLSDRQKPTPFSCENTASGGNARL